MLNQPTGQLVLAAATVNDAWRRRARTTGQGRDPTCALVALDRDCPMVFRPVEETKQANFPHLPVMYRAHQHEWLSERSIKKQSFHRYHTLPHLPYQGEHDFLTPKAVAKHPASELIMQCMVRKWWDPET